MLRTLRTMTLLAAICIPLTPGLSKAQDINTPSMENTPVMENSPMIDNAPEAIINSAETLLIKNAPSIENTSDALTNSTGKGQLIENSLSIQNTPDTLTNSIDKGVLMDNSTAPANIPSTGQTSQPVEETMPEQADQTSKPEMPKLIENIYFGDNLYDVPDESREQLDILSKWLIKSDKSLMIEGHCDERDTEDYNLELGERRAMAVKHYLLSLGVPGVKLSTVTYGESRPVCTEHNEKCWAMNRRVHLALDEAQ